MAALRIFEIKQMLGLLRQDVLSVADYFTQFKILWDQLSSYSTIPPCSCGASEEYAKEEEKEKVDQFLMGLGDSYNTIRSHILRTDPLLCLNSVYEQVEREERRLAASKGQVESTGKGPLFPTPPSPRLSQAQYDQLLSVLGPDKTHVDDQLSRMLPLNPQFGEWALDTGSSCHILPINHAVPSSSLDQKLVHLCNGGHLVVSHIGPHSIAPHFTLGDVLHIPDVTQRVISVARLTRDLKCMITFCPNLCVIQDRTTRGLIGLGEMRDGVYFLWRIASSFVSTN